MTRAHAIRAFGVIWLSVVMCVWFGWDAKGAAALASDGDGSDASISSQTTEDTSSASSEDEEEKEKRKREEAARAARAKKKASTGSESSETIQTPLSPPKTTPESRMEMPVAPTAAPGGPGTMGGTTPPVNYRPIPPTGFGGNEGLPPLGRRSGGSGAGEMAPSPFGPYVTPPTPTPSAVEGAAGTDPTLGRYSSYAVPQATGQFGVDQRPAVLPPAVTSKPFSDYKPPQAISPYMNLYGPGTTGIDNYNAYVKPQLEQQQRNYQTQRDMARLQQASHMQGTNLQQLNQQVNPYQRGMMPQRGGAQQQVRPAATFMNLQQYYPGFKR